MNQILENKKTKLFTKKLYFFQFCITCIILSFLIIYIFWQKYSESYTKKLSESTSKSYNITRLYSSSFKNTIKTNNNLVSIVGIIEIPKLNISYPILSNYSDELLKISVCKFYGPNINTIGNFCILGHNYNTSEFFGKLHLLKQNDIINIYDLNKNKLSYVIYTSYEVDPDNLSYLSQETGRKRRNYFNYL